MNSQQGAPEQSGAGNNSGADANLSTDCELTSKQLSLLLYGELSFDEEERVQQHLEVCGVCRGRLEQERLWHCRVDECELEPSQQLLDQCRRRLRLSVAAAQDQPRSFGSRMAALFFPAGLGWHTARAAAAGLALLMVGFGVGRHTESTSTVPTVTPEQLPVARVSSEPVASRVRFVEPDDSGSVRIMVEEVRQRVLRGGMDDQQIRSLLLTAATEAVDPGVRVETVDLLRGWGESQEVREALLEALQHDPNAGVRLKALEGLRRSAGSEATRRALTNVLLKDENPGIRIKAIDLLTETSEPELEGVLRQLLEREQNSYVRLKCQQALNAMSAGPMERY
jgi:hypothetical protein